MPSTAEWLVSEDDKAGNQVIGTRKAKGMARIDAVDAESAAAAWYVNPAIPDELKRMLDATEFPVRG
jgi:hypothetical protein